MKNLLKSVRATAVPDLAEAIAAIEGRIEALSEEGSKLYSIIEDRQVAQDLETDPDNILRNIAEIRAAQNRIRIIDGQVAVARNELDLARNEVRAAQLVDLKARIAATAEHFYAKSAMAVEAVHELLTARQALLDAGFKSEFNAFPPPPMIGNSLILDPDLIDLFATNYARVFNPPAPIKRAASAPATMAPPAQSHRLAQKPVKMTAPARPPLQEVAREGEKLIVILRSGVEDGVRGQLQSGDVIAVQHDHALTLMLNGAAEPVDHPGTSDAPQLELINRSGDRAADFAAENLDGIAQ